MARQGGLARCGPVVDAPLAEPQRSCLRARTGGRRLPVSAAGVGTSGGPVLVVVHLVIGWLVLHSDRVEENRAFAPLTALVVDLVLILAMAVIWGLWTGRRVGRRDGAATGT